MFRHQSIQLAAAFMALVFVLVAGWLTGAWR